MDRDIRFIQYYVTKIIQLHNLIGRMKGITYDDMFYKQNILRKIVKHVEEELEVKIDSLTDVRLEEIKMFDKRFLRLGE